LSDGSQFRLLAERRFGVQFLGAMNNSVFKLPEGKLTA
jgi:hypothetical protein